MHADVDFSRRFRACALQTTALTLAIFASASVASARPGDGTASVALSSPPTADSGSTRPPVGVLQADPIDFANSGAIGVDQDLNLSVVLTSTGGAVKATNNGTLTGGAELNVGNSTASAPGLLSVNLINSGAINGSVFLAAYDAKGASAQISVENSGSINNSHANDSKLVAALVLRRDVQDNLPHIPASYRVHNSGNITADLDSAKNSYGVVFNDPRADSELTITNDAGGVISARGARAFGIMSTNGGMNLTNAGVISATGADARSSFAIVASGGDSTITNTGTIDGDIVLGDGEDVVANAGTINGDVDLGGGDDIFVEGEGSKVSGTVDGGDGFDAYYHAFTKSHSITLAGDLPKNFELEGVRAVGSDTQVTVSAATPIKRDLVVNGDGSIINAADITGLVVAARSIDLPKGTILASFLNKGALSGGFLGTVRQFENVGKITAFADNAVDLSGAIDMSFKNAGTIVHSPAHARAVEVNNIGGAIDASNSGTIDGTAFLSSKNSMAAASGKPLSIALNNSGSIIAPSVRSHATATLRIDDHRGDDASLNVTNSGTIKRDATGVALDLYISNDAPTGKDVAHSIAVVNDGVIAAGPKAVDADDGGLTTALVAAANHIGQATISNKRDGQILAIGNKAVAVFADIVSVDLDNAGLIAASATGTPLFRPTAIYANGPRAALANSGKIVGDVVLTSATSAMTNSGTIAGDITFRGDDNVFNAKGGTVDGTITGERGTTIVRVSGSTTNTVSAFKSVRGIDALAVSGGKATISRDAAVGRIDLSGGSLVGLIGSYIDTKAVIVGKAATFGSAGVVKGDITVAGTLSPGASPGTMRVNGDVTLQSGSRTLFEITRSAQDQLLVDGKIAIQSGATLAFATNNITRPGTTYRLIAATKGVSGRYATIEGGDDLAVTQRRDEIDAIGLFHRSARSSPLVKGSIDYANQKIIAGASPSLAAHWFDLYDADGGSRADAFARLTPESYAAATQIGVDDALTLSQSARGPAFAPYGKDTGLFTFGQAVGQWHTLRADAATGTAPTIARTYGTLGGIGFADAGWVVGAFAGNLTNRQEVQGLGTETRVGSLVTGVHSRYASGSGLGFTSALIFDGGRARTHRWLPDARRVWGHYKLNSVTSDLSVFYAADVGHEWALTPRLGLTYVHTVRGGITEQGGSVFDLDVKRERHTAGFADGGFTFGRSDASVDSWRPFVTLGARYQLQGEGVRALARYAGGPLTLAASGASRASLVGSASAGVGYRPSDAIEIFAAGAAQTGRDDHQESITAGVRARF